MPEETIRIEVSDEEVDETIAKIEGALDKKPKVDEVRDSAEEARDVGDEAISKTGDLKGMNMAARRIMRQVPGLREASRLLSLIKMQMRIAPAVFALLMAWQTVRMIISWLGEREREAKEFRRMIMEARGFRTKSQFDNWLEEDKRRTAEAYRSVVPP